MIFGTRRFAIECQIRSASGKFRIGDVWLWADGMRIGDEVSGVDLPLVLAALSGPLLIGDRRHDVFFDSLSKEQVAEFFFKLVFTDEKVEESVAEVAATFRRYLLISAPDLEGFDTAFVLVLGTGDGGDRLIWKYKGMQNVHEQTLAVHEYDTVVLSCLDWVQEQTGYRAARRTWLGLNRPERDKRRRLILSKRPELGDPGQWERLDQAAIEAID
jgi:hypothetical protein